MTDPPLTRSSKLQPIHILSLLSNTLLHLSPHRATCLLTLHNSCSTPTRPCPSSSPKSCQLQFQQAKITSSYCSDTRSFSLVSTSSCSAKLASELRNTKNTEQISTKLLSLKRIGVGQWTVLFNTGITTLSCLPHQLRNHQHLFFKDW